jgi:hypothetical protein
VSHPLRSLTYQIVSRAALGTAERDRMWTLLETYYVDVDRTRFEADLAPKDHVILLLDRATRSVHGFSTLQVYARRVAGRRVGVLFSGDTIVDPAYWGQTALQRGWLEYAMRQKLQFLGCPFYWFLITKGYKTYLLLSRNFPEHWPRHDRPLAPFPAALLDTLAAEKFGAEYRAEQGIVRHGEPQGRLREAVAPIDAEHLAHPDIAFFVERNPGHASGDELCCLGRIDLGLASFYLTKLARRSARRLLPAWLARS